METGSPFVADAVWADLDPAAGRLSWRARWRVAGWSVVAITVLAALLAVAASGLVFPRLTAHDEVVGGTPADYTVQVAITNHGWVAESVSRVRVGGAGVHMVASRRKNHKLVRPGTTATFLLHIRVDCRITKAIDLSVIAEVSPPWGANGSRSLSNDRPETSFAAWSFCR